MARATIWRSSWAVVMSDFMSMVPIGLSGRTIATRHLSGQLNPRHSGLPSYCTEVRPRDIVCLGKNESQYLFSGTGTVGTEHSWAGVHGFVHLHGPIVERMIEHVSQDGRLGAAPGVELHFGILGQPVQFAAR